MEHTVLESKEKNKKELIFKVLFYFAVFFGINCLVYPILPLFDDWYYLTAPNPDFQLNYLLPGMPFWRLLPDPAYQLGYVYNGPTFWRPFDALFGAFMAYCPQLFPVLNRAVVILAHVLNAILLDAIAEKLGIKRQWRRFAVCFFLFSSSTWAVTTSPDALNQAYSVLLGVAAVWLYLKKGGYSYLLLCLGALFWKESGVSWFFVIPVLDAVLHCKTLVAFFRDKEQIKRSAIQVALGMLAVLAYFVARFALQGSISLGGGNSTYQLSLFSFSTIKNLVLLFASASTGVDSIALFGTEPSLLLVGITAVLSMVFLGSLLVCVIRMIKARNGLFMLLGLVVCALGLAFPLAILGNAGEMHAYPVLCSMTLVFAYCLDRSNFSVKQLCVSVVCIFLAFTISSAHKLTAIYEYSDRTERLTQRIHQVYDAPTGPALFVVVDNWEGYSVFTQHAAQGTCVGLSLRPYYDWAALDHAMYIAESQEDAEAFIQAYEDRYAQVFVIQGETVQKRK